MNKRIYQTGFSLLEILITVIVIAFGALGAAALQMKAVQNNHSAYLNTQAVLIAHDMSERMRSNLAGIQSKSYHLPTATANENCFTTNGCAPAEMAGQDMYEWAGKHSNSLITSLPQGSGIVCIDSTPNDGSETNAECDGTGESYAIKVWWRSMENKMVRTVITSTFNY